MKTLSMLLCGCALVGTASVAQAGPYDLYSGRTSNFYGHQLSQPSCVDGSCGHLQCQDGTCNTGFCATGTCATGNYATGRFATADCGHAGCVDGYCRYENRTRPYSSVTRPAATYRPVSNAHYTGYRPTSTCPGGVCPAPSRATTYPAVNHRPTYHPQQTYQAQRYNFLGLRF